MEGVHFLSTQYLGSVDSGFSLQQSVASIFLKVILDQFNQLNFWLIRFLKGFRVPYYIYLLLLVLQVRLPVPCAKVWLGGIKRYFDSHNVEPWLNLDEEKGNKNKYWMVNHSLCTIEIGFIITWINLSSRDWSIRKNLRTSSSIKSTEKNFGLWIPVWDRQY